MSTDQYFSYFHEDQENAIISSAGEKSIINFIYLLSNFKLLFYLQGNQENRVVVYDRKVVDYINFILRAGDIADCPPDKVSIGNCLMNKMCSPSNIAYIYLVQFVLPLICFN